VLSFVRSHHRARVGHPPSREHIVGRQIRFYMLPADRSEFLRLAQEYDSTTLVVRDSDSAQVQPIGEDVDSDKTLCLWNRKLLPKIERKWIPEPGYYRLDTLRAPILEFTRSFTATWEAKPALGQGRLFGSFEPYLGKPEEFGKWYESLVRWIRQHYRKNTASSGGYVGPGAYDFYEKGGYLLPNFLPPRTKEWVTEIGKQHARSRTPLRSAKRARARS
jgi:hypothetical protein